MKRALLFVIVMMVAPQAFAQTVRAWISPGDSCETGSKLVYEVGRPFKVSICAQWEGASCGFSAQIVSQDAGLFQIIGSALHPNFDDANSLTPPTVKKPWPVTSSIWSPDFGGTSGGQAFEYDGRPLAVLDLVATYQATGARYAIAIGGHSEIGISEFDPQYPQFPCSLPYGAMLATTVLTLDNVLPALSLAVRSEIPALDREVQ